MHDEIIVLKFGSSVLSTAGDIPNAVHEIYRWYRRGARVVAVVSAIGDTTNRLFEEARGLALDPQSHCLAALLATGERASAALLGIALDRSGIPSRVLDPAEITLTVEGGALDSEPVAADRARCRAFLEEYPVLVIPGFFGSKEGRTQLLGRGGSDLSAVFLAHLFGATTCRLIKDVDGIYEADPAAGRELPLRRFVSVTYADARRVAGPLIQSKAIAFLEQTRASAEVAALGFPYASKVHEGLTESADPGAAMPSSVVLLGLGTVGFGVYQRLIGNSARFQILGVLVRNAAKHRAAHVPQALLHDDSDLLCKLQPDLVIDALPGIEPSYGLVRHFLDSGAGVITANKALIAEHGMALDGLAARAGTRLRYSAAVGGACPMIETTDRVRSQDRISSLKAVLNGTCNFVLDRCAQGASLEEAIAEAKARGFAEQDPSDDLNGRDAQRKLRVLCRHAFDAEPDFVEAELLDGAIAARARLAAGRGLKLRQIARAFFQNARLIASINFEVVACESAFGQLEREWNGLEIRRQTSVFVQGRGAGRWPTAEAVMADLFDAHRERVENHCALSFAANPAQRATGRVTAPEDPLRDFSRRGNV